MRNLVVGAGVSGAVIANLIATNTKEDVVVIDKRNHIAGNCFDYRDENGITIHKYGSHIFHTNSNEVWEYVNRFCDFRNYIHEVTCVVGDKKINLPFNLNSLYKVYDEKYAKKLEEKLLLKFKKNSEISILDFSNQEDEDLNNLFNYIKENIFLNYTKKQWGVSLNDIDKAVIARIPVRINKLDNYFSDKYQGIPQDGYTKLIEKMLNYKNIEVRLNTDFMNIKENFCRIFYTGSIDEFFNYKFGKLPYRSVEFEFETYNMQYFQEYACVNYPNEKRYTRIHEYKYYLGEKSLKTVIAKEFPKEFKEGKNERMYPVVNEKNLKIYKKYLDCAKDLKNIFFLGRLGDYKYYDMDKAILRAFEVYKTVFED